VLFFVALAVVNVILKGAGSVTLDINEHFKYAWVRILVAMVLLALAANLFGLFHVTVPSKVADVEGARRREGHLPAAGMGVMMAVLSTPCSFWLMALALAWAQLQPLWLGTVTIVLIGVGMAVPHAVLAAFPGLLNRLPKPGVWMEHFKKTMGFLLLPAVLYLLSTLSEGGGYPFLVAGFGVALAFGLWVWGTWVRFDAPVTRKLLVRGFAVAVVAAAGWLLLPEPAAPPLEFEEFSEARIDQARKDGRVVLVKVTAAWCTECKILDYQVFDTPKIAAELKRRNVLAVTADVTDRSRPASRWVEKRFGGAPPLTIVYPASGGEPTAVPGRFTKAELIDMLDQAAS
jgi:thiol:disulfide interchange protein